MIKDIAFFVSGIIIILFFVAMVISSEKQTGMEANTEPVSVGYGIERYDTKDGYVCFTYIRSIDCLRKEEDNGGKN